MFRKIDEWGNIDRLALTPQSVNLILKSRCEKAGLDPAKFSAHGLHSTDGRRRRCGTTCCGVQNNSTPSAPSCPSIGVTNSPHF